MPYRKRYYRKKYKKKRGFKGRTRKYRKRRRYANKINYMRVRGVTGFPDQLVVKLKYNEAFTMTNVGGFGSYTYRLNSLFDPNFTGTGHQPMNFDQYSALYQDYEVKASKLYVDVIPPDVNPIKVATIPARISTAPASIEQMSENTYSRVRWFANATTQQQGPIVNFMTVKKLEGRTTASVNYIANTGTNPSSTRFWHILVDSFTGTDISDIVFDVTIIYYSRFMRRIDTGLS